MIFLLRRLMPVLAGLGCAILFELMLRFPDRFLLGTVALILWSSLALSVVVGWSHRRRIPAFLVSPVGLVAAASGVFLFMDQPLVVHLMVAAVSLCLGLALAAMFAWLEQPARYQPYTLENMFSYMNHLTVFGAAVAANGTLVLLGVSRWFLLPAILAITMGLAWQTLWVQKNTWRATRWHLAVLGLLLGQAFLVLSFLPTGIFVNGLLLTIGFYFLVNLFRHALQGRLDRTVWRRYGLIASTVVLLALATARWT